MTWNVTIGYEFYSTIGTIPIYATDTYIHNYTFLARLHSAKSWYKVERYRRYTDIHSKIYQIGSYILSDFHLENLGISNIPTTVQSLSNIGPVVPEI